MTLFKRSNLPGVLSPESFAITNSDYGVTGEIQRCVSCGFLQCSNLTEVLPFYEDLEDPAYEAGRDERALQARQLLRVVKRYSQGNDLLDIGAGAGILVQEARNAGFSPVGIEPSRYLQKQAERHGLPVVLGTFPHPDVSRPFDVVTLIDVLEHVPNPVQLLRGVQPLLKDTSVGVVVTPDVRSLAARLIGSKWWHYRVAHIGYFSRPTLQLALSRAGLEAIAFRRAGWYFRASYLWERIPRFLPGSLRLPALPFLRNTIVPLNLADSLLVVFRRAGVENRNVRTPSPLVPA